MLRIFLVFSLVLPSACRHVADQNAYPDAYFEAGEMWAYGFAKLREPHHPGQLVVENLTPELSLNDPESRFLLYRAINGQTDLAKKLTLAYVDYDPRITAGGDNDEDDLRTLAYVYNLDYRLREGTTGVLDVYAILARQDGGRSFERQREIHLGAATYPEESDQTVAEFKRDEKTIQLSEVSDGIVQGRWALHPIEIPRASQVQDGSGTCDDIRALPGSLPNQTHDANTQHACRPIPALEDLCEEGDNSPECQTPEPTTTNPSPTPEIGTISLDDVQQIGEDFNLTRLEPGIYEVENKTKPVQLTFFAEELLADQRDIAADCDARFFAVARTATNEVHPTCTLTPSPNSTVIDGKLTCTVKVEFTNPLTYREKPCTVMGVFQGSETKSFRTLKIVTR